MGEYAGWPDADTLRLLQLVKVKGNSASKIALALGHDAAGALRYSRMAVIGKCHRLGLQLKGNERAS